MAIISTPITTFSVAESIQLPTKNRDDGIPNSSAGGAANTGGMFARPADPFRGLSQPSTATYQVAVNLKQYTPYVKQTQAFVQGPRDATSIHFNDVRQGFAGTCSSLAVAMSLANSQRGRALISRMVYDNGGGTYTVTMAGKPMRMQTEKIMSSEVKTGDYNGNSKSPKWEIWPKAIEMGFARFAKEERGITITRGEGGPGTTLSDALETLTGQPAHITTADSMSDTRFMQVIGKALDEQKAIVTSSKSLKSGFGNWHSEVATAYGLVENHTYSVLGINRKDNTIWLGDPHGKTVSLPMDVYRQYFVEIGWAYVP